MRASKRRPRMQVVSAHAHAPPQRGVLPVGCRCASLEALHVNAKHYPGVDVDIDDDEDGDLPFGFSSHFKACFHGRGSTPADRCSHLQHQLAAITRGSDFLAPASWPTCSCLQALNLLLLMHTSHDAPVPHLRAALHTTSLRRLGINIASLAQDDETSGLHLGSISNLRSLTCLQLWSVFTPLPAPVMAAIACLHDLATLDVGMVEVTPDVCR
jgi:hypothetical protein